MKIILALLIFSFFQLVYQAQADELLSGQQIAENIVKQDEGVSRFSNMKMILKNKRGKTRKRVVRTYRKYFEEPSKLHSSKIKCPFCHFAVGKDSRFCRMCGTYPI